MEGSMISSETPAEIKVQQQPRSLEEEWKELEAQKRELAAQKLNLDAKARELEAVSLELISVSNLISGVIREVAVQQDRLLLMMKVFCLIMLIVIYQQVTFNNRIQEMNLNCNCTCTMPEKNVTVEPQQVSSNYTYEDPVDPLTHPWMRNY